MVTIIAVCISTNTNVAYTGSKDNQYVYVIMKEWPGQELQLKGLNAERGSKIEYQSNIYYHE
ncbi:MAG: hypothetical protein M0R21_11490 [Lentimicrobiaceae bacterium]|nr:hypothetical protein [Lentimicrobiaceae bacterium]